VGPPGEDGPDPGSGAEASRREEVLQGTIDVVTYRDEKTLYSVLRVLPERGYGPPGGSIFALERLTAVGRAPHVAEGLRVRLFGAWSEHKRHGAQFEFDSLEELAPADEAGLVRYLSSKVFEGIGDTLARRIVKKLGKRALERIHEDPACLDGIRGLRPEVALQLGESVRAQLGAHRTRAFLHGIGLGPLQTQAAIGRLGPDCERAVGADPYLLARVPGLGFASADRIARGMGLAPDDPRRVAASVLHALGAAADEGHSLLPRGELGAALEGLLGTLRREALAETLAALEAEGEVVVESRAARDEEGPGEGARESPSAVYLPWLLASERGLARSLARIAAPPEVAPLATERELARAERAGGIELHADQRAAVLELLRRSLALLTGGPGVGKTTIIRLVASLAEAAGCRVRLASPTGRAAKRLAEATGREASTIHRLLGYLPGEGRFEHGAEKPLEAGMVIVDEISMLDVVLAHHLAKAIEPPTRLVLVGDPDQLPSVGPGNVLRDLIDSGCVPVARLTRIFRQDAHSLIVANAHRILAGELPRLPGRGDLGADFYLFPSEEPAQTAQILVDVVTQRIPRTFGFDWVRDVQVIAPMYRGECGVDVLNERLREALGAGGRELVRGGLVWRVGDRVIHTRNDYDKEVFNGDMGRIVDVSPEGTLSVRFPEQTVGYSGAEVSDLRPAFAITVHRSQGGEFPVVVVPLVTQHYRMLQRNLLYTAITRARKLVVLVGSRRALRMAVENAEQAQRRSGLVERLRGGR